MRRVPKPEPRRWEWMVAIASPAINAITPNTARIIACIFPFAAEVVGLANSNSSGNWITGFAL